MKNKTKKPIEPGQEGMPSYRAFLKTYKDIITDSKDVRFAYLFAYLEGVMAGNEEMLRLLKQVKNSKKRGKK